ncbi:MAG: prolipoprotein diacylglyceryl transferase [Polyangiaceae bacterium]|nr:prolipoprotein diacylglyceryl transferase [Polyangiaceae bacterium]
MASSGLKTSFRGIVGRVAYGALFVVVLPWLLWKWTTAAEDLVVAPPIHRPTLGAVLIAAGASLILAGWHALYRHGGGLPMNAYPPPKRVTRGVYRWLAHPIYVGFDLGLVGVALYTGSRALLWLVTPIVTLASVALLYGFEIPALMARFGPRPDPPLLSLPPENSSRPRLAQRVSAMLFGIVIPWIALYQSVTWLGPPLGAVETYLELERAWPVWTPLYPVYFSVDVVTPLVALLARDNSLLRRFVVRVWVASAIAFPMLWFLPLIATARPIPEQAMFGELLLAQRSLDSARGALPSFHVIFAMLCSASMAESWPRARWAAWAWTLLVAASCVSLGVHGLLDVVAGGAIAAIAIHHQTVWRALLRLTERVANSWREWRVGRVRIIVHGGWAALSSATGVLCVLALLGPGATVAAVVAALAGLVGAALWAQWVEGSPALLRPYGYYGGLLGILLGALAAPAFGVSTWSLLAAYAVAGAPVQALGRIRCLVQGCCHGAPAPESVGIRYRHPRSRVVRLSPWENQPLHPTPLYSILVCALTLLVQARLWAIGAPAALLIGSYLMLNGLGRFVEEAYRGETQTPVHGALRLYQWVALAGIVAGAALSAVHGSPATGSFQPWLGALWPALACGVLVGAALGVDFPESNQRFARLA